MSRQKALWFAGLSLVVGSLATATAASAQARSDVRRRRTGKQQAAQPARTDTVTITRSDTVRVRDTVFVDRPLPAPPPRVDTVRLAPPPPPVRLGYFGVVGGVGLPLSHTKDGTYGSSDAVVAGASAPPGYNVGPSVFGFLGVNSRSGVLGLRLDGGYTLLRGKNIGNGYSAHNGIDQVAPDLAIYQGTLNGVIRAPFGRDSVGNDHGGLYIFGGGGVAHLRSFLQDNANSPNVEENITRALIQGGAGLELGALGSGKIFAEGRFVYIFTPGTKVTFVPVGLGVRF